MLYFSGYITSGSKISKSQCPTSKSQCLIIITCYLAC